MQARGEVHALMHAWAGHDECECTHAQAPASLLLRRLHEQ
jgi:hypothetical protein